MEDISPLIAPTAETLATYGAHKLSHLIFNTNERWGESTPINGTRPQPADAWDSANTRLPTTSFKN